MENSIRNFAVQLFKINGVQFGDFTLKNKLKSPIYFDLRVIMSYPELMTDLSNIMCSKIRQHNPTHICGVPYTALPIATLIAVALKKSLLLRRKEVKDYGRKRTIEGCYKYNDQVIIVEDVITSGSSVAETADDLEKEGLHVTHAVVVIDREQGGREFLLKRGIKPIILLSITELLNIFQENNLITKTVSESVTDWIKGTGTIANITDGQSLSRLKMGIKERMKLSTPLVKQIFKIMESKKSLLVVAADVTTSQQLLEMARKVGPFIVLFKTHVDLIADFSTATAVELNVIAEEYNFLILEDKKFCDIGHIAERQYKNVASWAHIVTAHSLPGPGSLEAIKVVAKDHPKPRGCFLVAELSSKGNLTSKTYAQAAVEMSAQYTELVIGFVCQHSDIFRKPEWLQLTPGVKFTAGQDQLGQQYCSPEEAVLNKGADLIVVGRGITEESDPTAAALQYQTASWNAFCIRTEHNEI